MYNKPVVGVSNIITVAFLSVCTACSTPVKKNPELAPVEDRSTALSADNIGNNDIRYPSGRAGSYNAGESMQGASPALVALLHRAQTEADTGRRNAAVATLERAIRLEPKNAVLWHRMAMLKLEQGEWHQASTMASRSNSLTNGNHALQVLNLKIIILAREQTGDTNGATEAKRKLEALSRIE
jgi:predicted Zn-dependent protease